MLWMNIFCLFSLWELCTWVMYIILTNLPKILRMLRISRDRCILYTVVVVKSPIFALFESLWAKFGVIVKATWSFYILVTRNKKCRTMRYCYFSQSLLLFLFSNKAENILSKLSFLRFSTFSWEIRMLLQRLCQRHFWSIKTDISKNFDNFWIFLSWVPLFIHTVNFTV